jgi:hypothetical protein
MIPPPHPLYQMKTSTTEHIYYLVQQSRIPPTTIRNSETAYDPHLVVTCPEIANITRLKIAHLRTALVLCVAGLWVLPCVLHTMMQ